MMNLENLDFELDLGAPVEDYDGEYYVNTSGNVFSLKFGKVRKLKPGKNNCGYLLVNLCKNGVQRTKLVHQIVAETFLKNPLNFPDINHKDENKLNNSLENLEYCDHQYNQDYSQSKPVSQFNLDGTWLASYKSAHEAARITGIDRSNISKSCRGKIPTAGDYIWKFKELDSPEAKRDFIFDWVC